jgi:hypothetical protein
MCPTYEAGSRRSSGAIPTLRRMATAWLKLDAFDRLPDICVKTGAPTKVRLPMAAEYVPGPLRWLQLYGIWSLLFAHNSNKRRRVVKVPVSAEAWSRHRTWQLGSVAVVILAAALGMYGSLSGRATIEAVGYAVAVLAFALGARAHHVTWIGLHIDRRAREVTVTRCHPDFARAAGRVARR